MQYKIHPIVVSKTRASIYGLTVPQDIVQILGDKTKFFVKRSGTAIIFESGASIYPTEKEIESYEFEDCKIEVKNEDSDT